MKHESTGDYRMFIHWRRDHGTANSRERFQLLHAEGVACAMAVQRDCLLRCDQDPIGVADCSNVAVVRVQRKWGRSKGRLFIILRCHMTPSGNWHEFKYNLKR